MQFIEEQIERNMENMMVIKSIRMIERLIKRINELINH